MTMRWHLTAATVSRYIITAANGISLLLDVTKDARAPRCFNNGQDLEGRRRHLGGGPDTRADLARPSVEPQAERMYMCDFDI